MLRTNWARPCLPESSDSLSKCSLRQTESQSPLNFAFMSTELALLEARRCLAADSGVTWVYQALKGLYLQLGSFLHHGVLQQVLQLLPLCNSLRRASHSRSKSLSPTCLEMKKRFLLTRIGKLNILQIGS